MKTLYYLVVLVFISAQNINAQARDNAWGKKKCAVVLTYDDALNVHLDIAIPVLDSLKLKGTFYLSGSFPGCRDRIRDWRKAALNGHELGNHTLFHPCLGNMPGREWVSAGRKMEEYSLQRMTEEVKMNNILLNAIDGKSSRTFAYPCGDTRIRDSAYLDMKDFVAARGTQPERISIAKIDLSNINCTSVNGQSGEQLIKIVQQAINEGGLLVFLFHGVGGEHSLNVSAAAHRELVYYLKKHENEIWIAPLIDVAQQIKTMQNGSKLQKATAARGR